MDKRTLGGKKKLVFEPKMPTRPLEEQPASTPTAPPHNEVRRKEVTPRHVKPSKHPQAPVAVTLMGGEKESKPFLFSANNSEEITDDHLEMVDDSPLTVNKILNAVKSTGVSECTGVLCPGSRVLLQIPNILPAGNCRYINGKLRIVNNEMYLHLTGRISVGSSVEEHVFQITPVRVGMSQEGYRITSGDTSISKMGRVNTKFISSVVRQAK
ncbi:hypothetical protein NEPAR05_0596 [Nematocida parisii]|uniref:Uncharacterized protein n=1 Tax=Nematocida parisii (strain ERTm3) TaxID=935791 RepID=I3EI82_NEMP3|nr:hypothetical protein NEQG_00748 [Nematocida parisii ERTm3]KAI5143708.1 hypothetical protein NEPAR07_0806 [Nematocida parisii]KAI5156466.1 hypothetical protein NEPAR05_0596 [Nematocida parisii]